MADFPPAHPGDVLREDFLKPLKLSQYARAKIKARFQPCASYSERPVQACQGIPFLIYNQSRVARRSFCLFSIVRPGRSNLCAHLAHFGLNSC
jgi:hypothetical protein